MNKIRRYLIGCACMLMGVMSVFAQKSFASADEGDIYTITYDLIGVTCSTDITEVTEGSSLSMSFTAGGGYTLPEDDYDSENFQVIMDGVRVTDGYIYKNGDLVIDSVYGDLEVIVHGVEVSEVPEIYNISYDLYEVKASKQDGNIEAGTTYSVKLQANSGFKLNASNVAVSVNNEYINEGYSFSDGVLVIDSVNGDVVIEAIAVPKASSNSNNKDKNTNSNSTKQGNKSGSSTSGGNSKSAQALAKSGKSAVNYSSGTYTAPRTGEVVDIRYFGALALIFIGAGVVVAGKRIRKA